MARIDGSIADAANAGPVTTTPRSPDVSHQEREYPRYAHEAAITLNTPDRVISGRTSNLSLGGLCAMLPEPIVVGTAVEVRFLPLDAERAEYLTMFLRYLDDRGPSDTPAVTSVDDRFG